MSSISAHNQKAFVQKLKKQTANENRRRVASNAKVAELPLSTSSVSLVSYNTDTSLSDVLDPLDFEQVVAQQERREHLRCLVDFPTYDLVVVPEKRPCKTVQPSLPEDGILGNNPMVRDCINCYTRDFVTLQRQFESANKHHLGRDCPTRSLPSQTYEVDLESTDKADQAEKCYRPIVHGRIQIEATESSGLFREQLSSSIQDLRKTPADPMLPNLLQSEMDSEQRERQNAHNRQVNRQEKLFTLYPLQDQDQIIEVREPIVKPGTERQGHRLHLRCLQLRLELEVEPIFASACLYDAANRCRISENFYFDMNSDELLDLLSNSGGPQQILDRDAANMARSSVFNLTNPNPDIFLIIRLEKVLQQGDISEIVESYLKDDKNKDKLRQQVNWCCQHLGKYRMPFAWTAIDLVSVLIDAQAQETCSSSGYSTATPGINSGSIPGVSVSSLSTVREHSPGVSSVLPSGGGSIGSTAGSMISAQFASLRRAAGRAGSTANAMDLNKRNSYTHEDTEKLLDNVRPAIITVRNFFRQESDKLSEDDLFKYLSDIRRPSSGMKRLKSIPGLLELRIESCPEDLSNLLTPEHLKVAIQPANRTATPTRGGVAGHSHSPSSSLQSLGSFSGDITNPAVTGRPTLEILEMPSKEVFIANTFYRNLLYVYPRSVNFSGRQGSARNIAVRVQFILSEGDRFKPLPVIFGKSNCPEFSSEAFTTVLYHSKSPDFYDEMKIQLPGHLQEKHFLLFTFYHISCQPKKLESTNGPESVIGHSWLPLLQDGRLESGDYSLMISQDRPKGSVISIRPELQEMTDKFCIDAMKWVDSHKELFKVSIAVQSSVHPQDPAIDRFLKSVHRVESMDNPEITMIDNYPTIVPNPTPECIFRELDHAIRDLPRNCNLESLVKFSTVVFDRLLVLLTAPPIGGEQGAKLEQDSFEVLARLVSRISQNLPDKNDSHARNKLLLSYVRYAASIPKLSSSELQNNSSNPGLAKLYRPSSVPSCQQYASAKSSVSPPGSALPLSRGTNPNFSIYESNQTQSNRRPEKHFHEELLFRLLMACRSIHQVELVMDSAWFFFELLIRSMTEHMIDNGLFECSRAARFSTQFVEDVTSLVSLVIRFIVDHHHTGWMPTPSQTGPATSVPPGGGPSSQQLSSGGPASFHSDLSNHHFLTNHPSYSNLTIQSQTQNLNRALAHFLTYLFSYMDRTFVLQQIKHCCTTITSKIAVEQDVAFLIHLKLEFLRIVSSHEHFIQLNLPLLINNRSSPLGLLTDQFRETHFLVGLILAEVKLCLESGHPGVQNEIVHLVWQLLSSHELDPRYQDSAVRARVAHLYLPLMGIVCVLLPILYNPATAAASANNHSNTVPSSPLVSPLVESRPYPTIGSDALPSGDTSGSATAGFFNYSQQEFSVSVSNIGQDKKCPLKQLEEDTTRHLLLCCVWLLKNIDSKTSHEWLISLNQTTVCQFMELLKLINANFEYKGHKLYHQWANKKFADAKRLEDSVLIGSASVRSDVIRRKGSQASLESSLEERSQSSKSRWRKDIPWLPSTSNSNSSSVTQPSPAYVSNTNDTDRYALNYKEENSSIVRGNLSLEVGMVVLDTMELVIQIFSQSDMLQTVLEWVLRVLLHAVSINQCVSAIQNLLATQRALVTKFPEFVFEEETEQCGDLCSYLLRHCSSRLAEIRSHAAASLYMLMRQNFELGNNFARVKLQVTMSLSSLVTQQSSVVSLHEAHLRKSLRTLLAYAESDQEMAGGGSGSFPEQVEELMRTLYMILSDTLKMREFEQDPEMLLDLMYRIAKGYQNSPDLRLRWLLNMAEKHKEKNQLAEAGQCFIHCAALVAEYLGMMEPLPQMPTGCAAFTTASTNALEESAVSEDVVSPGEEEGVCCSSWFTAGALERLINDAADCLGLCGHLEVAIQLYKLVEPIHEENRDFNKLQTLYSKMQNACRLIHINDGRRMFGTYFRVGFYGTRFGDLDGEEFIYKEPPLTKLPEIASRLETFYSERFGQDHLVIIKDSNIVEKDKLNTDQAYIQITYVEPYFEQYELRRRKTHFEKNYNLKTFMFATPFTQDGRAHGELSKQYKRKTLLTTSKAFPYVKTRLNVIKREYIILAPLEVAIEDLTKKIEQLTGALRQEPADPKFLQMVLQGCIGTTVNQGPVEMAMVFLSDVAEGREPASRFHNKLRLCFKEFLRRSQEALLKNRQLISTDQKEYQRELERNFKNIQDQLQPLIVQPNSKRINSNKSKGSDSPQSTC